ncbi:MAG: hypothetical protein ACHREM_11750 [Polyangiales bacterium]
MSVELHHVAHGIEPSELHRLVDAEQARFDVAIARHRADFAKRIRAVIG